MAAAIDLLDAQVVAFGRPVRYVGVVVGDDLDAATWRWSSRASVPRRHRRRRSRRWPRRSASRRRLACRCGTRSLTDSLAFHAPSSSAWVSPARSPSRVLSRPSIAEPFAAGITSCGSGRADRSCGHDDRGLVLHPSPALVHAAVASLTTWKGSATRRASSGARQPSRTTRPVGRHNLDPRSPCRVGAGGPSAHSCDAVACDDVDHAVPLEIDDLGRPDRGVLPVDGRYNVSSNPS